MALTSNTHLTNTHLYANDVDLSHINTELTEETRDFACLTAGYPLVTSELFSLAAGRRLFKHQPGLWARQARINTARWMSCVRTGSRGHEDNGVRVTRSSRRSRLISYYYCRYRITDQRCMSVSNFPICSANIFETVNFRHGPYK